MANYNKNLFVGIGGSEAINLSHFIGAVRVEGIHTPPLYAHPHQTHSPSKPPNRCTGWSA